MLASNPYIIVISLDFSKAFDTVQQSTMLHKLDQLDISNNVYDWFVDYFSGHSHSMAASSRRTSPSMPVLYKALWLAVRHMLLLPVISGHPSNKINLSNMLMTCILSSLPAAQIRERRRLTVW